MSISSERIVWIDCEMTGLDVENDALVEVGVLVTDSDLNILCLLYTSLREGAGVRSVLVVCHAGVSLSFERYLARVKRYLAIVSRVLALSENKSPRAQALSIQ